jgi:hypothetical protein
MFSKLDNRQMCIKKQFPDNNQSSMVALGRPLTIRKQKFAHCEWPLLSNNSGIEGKCWVTAIA